MTDKTKPRYYECGICGHNHPWQFNGDCREDASRFTDEALDAMHGTSGYELSPMDARVAADGAEDIRDVAIAGVRLRELKDRPASLVQAEPLSAQATKKVSELVPGDLVDLEGDKFADKGDHPEFEFEYATVGEIVKETAECTVVYFDNFTCGFPADHIVKIGD